MAFPGQKYVPLSPIFDSTRSILDLRDFLVDEGNYKCIEGASAYKSDVARDVCENGRVYLWVVQGSQVLILPAYVARKLLKHKDKIEGFEYKADITNNGRDYRSVRLGQKALGVGKNHSLQAIMIERDTAFNLLDYAIKADAKEEEKTIGQLLSEVAKKTGGEVVTVPNGDGTFTYSIVGAQQPSGEEGNTIQWFPVI